MSEKWTPEKVKAAYDRAVEQIAALPDELLIAVFVANMLENVGLEEELQRRKIPRKKYWPDKMSFEAITHAVLDGGPGRLQWVIEEFEEQKDAITH